MRQHSTLLSYPIARNTIHTRTHASGIERKEWIFWSRLFRLLLFFFFFHFLFISSHFRFCFVFFYFFILMPSCGAYGIRRTRLDTAHMRVYSQYCCCALRIGLWHKPGAFCLFVCTRFQHLNEWKTTKSQKNGVRFPKTEWIRRDNKLLLIHFTHLLSLDAAMQL